MISSTVLKNSTPEMNRMASITRATRRLINEL